MSLTRLFPGTVERFDLETQAHETLAKLYEIPRTQWLRINLIASINGNVAGADGTSHGLTNATDRRILGAIRRLADVVLVGATSVRREGYFLPKSAPLAIVTGSGDLSGHQIPSKVESGRVIVLCPPEAQETLQRTLGGCQVTVITLPGPRLDPTEIVASLWAQGYDSIVCEGGPTLAGGLLDAGLVNEICLSTSPIVNHTNVPVFSGNSHGAPLQLRQLLIDAESALYARWRVQIPSATTPTIP